MMNTTPLITVLMPTYNQEQYVKLALQSIVNQSYRKLEILIIDDASQDQTVKVIKQIHDQRIKLLVHRQNKGLSYTLNEGMAQAQGEFIARMDGDDLAHPQRLKKQLHFLHNNPKVGIVGCWAQTFGENAHTFYLPPTTDDAIKANLLFDSPMVHPSVMFRRELIAQHTIQYQVKWYPADDYYFWAQLAKVTQLANVPEFLLRYRVHPTQATSKKKQIQKSKYEVQVQLAKECGLKLSQSQNKMLFELGQWRLTHSMDTDISKFFSILEKGLSQYFSISPKQLRLAVGKRLLRATISQPTLFRLKFWRYYLAGLLAYTQTMWLFMGARFKN